MAIAVSLWRHPLSHHVRRRMDHRKNTHEPLLSEELFEKVQEVNRAAVERTKANSGKYDHLPKAKNIYGKKSICAECGAIMKLHRPISTKKDKVYFTFKCPTYAEHGARGCSDIKMRKQDFDEAVFAFIKSQMEVFLDIVLFHIPPYTPEMNPIEQIWKEIRKRGFRNEIFATLEKVVDRLCDTICSLNHEIISSITGR